MSHEKFQTFNYSSRNMEIYDFALQHGVFAPATVQQVQRAYCGTIVLLFHMGNFSLVTEIDRERSFTYRYSG